VIARAGRLAILVCLPLASCSWFGGHGAPGPGHHHHHHGPGGPPSKAAAKPPEKVDEVMMISWAEPAPDGCEADLEGTAKPASFSLRYTVAGAKPVDVESDPNQLFADGWEIITRSERGLGFEKRADFTALDFDIVEELRCTCAGQTKNHLAGIKLGWKPGAKPAVSARLQDEKGWTDVRPVTINGRIPTWEFRFAPTGQKQCSSRFLVVMGVDQPLE
jgi:hypothetical protein